MSKWIPDWATHYEIEQSFNSSLGIEFYNLPNSADAWRSLKPISQLAHDLAVSDVLSQMKAKPLSERMDVPKPIDGKEHKLGVKRSVTVNLSGEEFSREKLRKALGLGEPMSDSFIPSPHPRYKPGRTSVHVTDNDDVDNVNAPKHYQLMPGVEVYHVRSALLDKMDQRDDITPGMVDDWSRAWEYLTRMWEKNGKEDAQKCRWYLNKLIEKLK